MLFNIWILSDEQYSIANGENFGRMTLSVGWLKRESSHLGVCSLARYPLQELSSLPSETTTIVSLVEFGVTILIFDEFIKNYIISHSQCALDPPILCTEIYQFLRRNALKWNWFFAKVNWGEPLGKTVGHQVSVIFKYSSRSVVFFSFFFEPFLILGLSLHLQLVKLIDSCCDMWRIM